MLGLCEVFELDSTLFINGVWVFEISLSRVIKSSPLYKRWRMFISSMNFTIQGFRRCERRHYVWHSMDSMRFIINYTYDIIIFVDSICVDV